MKVIIENLSKWYGSFCALDNISFTAEAGQIVALLGPNGAGKTTLLRCTAGLLIPDRGVIYYDGAVFRRNRLDLRRRFAFVSDSPSMFPTMTVIQHIGMMLRIYEAERDGIEDLVIQILRDFDLLVFADVPIAHLSRGQIYKAALAGLLAVDPELWLVDEPFGSGMDPGGVSAFKRYVRDAVKRGRTIFYSTQLLEIAERFSDKFCLIHKGSVQMFDSVARLQEWKVNGGSVLEELFKQLGEE